MTQETDKRPNGAAVRHDYYEGIPHLGAAAAATSYANFALHSRKIATQKRAPGRFEGRNFWRPRASGPPRNS